jgi:hypothetical protein
MPVQPLQLQLLDSIALSLTFLLFVETRDFSVMLGIVPLPKCNKERLHFSLEPQ